MQLISCHSGKLQTLASGALAEGATRGEGFETGLEALDAVAPGKVFARGAIHELLWAGRNEPMPLTVAMTLAKAAAGSEISNRKSQISDLKFHKKNSAAAAIVWCDSKETLYPPALATAGVDLSRLFLLRCANRDEELWGLTEALRCRGVGAAVCNVSRLTRVEARRLQLAAETGGSVGILLRPLGAASAIYAAATRWRVEPAAGDRTAQRWKIQLVHGHGGRVGHNVYLEYSRETTTIETNPLRATDQLADRLPAETVGRRAIA